MSIEWTEGTFSEDDISRAMAAASENRLCRRCLGRLFGMEGHGLSNIERGDILVRAGVPVVPEEECDICEGMFSFMDDYVGAVLEALSGYEFDTYVVGCHVDGHVLAAEAELARRHSLDNESIKSEFNRVLGKALASRFAEEGISVRYDPRKPDMTIIVDTTFVSVELQVSPLFIFGRYRKLERGVPQTRWPCRKCRGIGCSYCNGTGKLYPTSVEEEIARVVMEHTGGEGHAFHGMGREDIDALMLGTGRPFVLEIVSPRKRHLDLKQVARAVNERSTSVEVELLRPCTMRLVRFIKSADPTKEYVISVRIEGSDKNEIETALDVLRGAEIAQRTPRRVSHRRADLVRKRKVHDIELLSWDGENAEIRVHGQSGLYIKELMTGDSDRTDPSLAGLLGREVSVNYLDVIAVHDENLRYPE